MRMTLKRPQEADAAASGAAAGSVKLKPASGKAL
jgi:hypothetical protein